MLPVLYGSIGWRHPLGLGKVAEWARDYGWSALDARGISLDIPQNDHRRVGAFGYDMLSPRFLRPSARAELRACFEEHGVRLLGIYCSSPVNLPGDLGRACRELVLDYLQLGVDLGCEWIRPINNTTDAVEGSAMSPPEAYERTVAGMREVGRRAADLGIGLLLENNENTVTHDAATLNSMRDDLGSVCRIGTVFDAANAYFQGLDPAAELAALGNRVDILHLKNVRRHTDSRWDYMPRGDFSYEWTSLADGDLDWHALVRQAAGQNFDGPLVYEYVNPFKGMPPAYWDTLPEPHHAARDAGAFLKQLIEQSKR